MTPDIVSSIRVEAAGRAVLGGEHRGVAALTVDGAPPEAAACTVEKKCSSSGKLCAPDDRACQSDAVAGGLEVTCERVEPRGYVYCPPGAQQRDSSVVWILLAVALAIATFGGIAAYFLFRKPVTR